MSILTRAEISTFTPLVNHVFVTDLDSGVQKTKNGILIPDDNMTNRGVRPRWGQVYAVGPDVTELKPGEWIYIEHGRWTERITLQFEDHEVNVWRVDFPAAVMVASETDPRNTDRTTL
jgi:co-chaperonin GroES (HSP10)